MAPAQWSFNEVEKAIDSAQNAYLNAITESQKEDPKPVFPNINWRSYPDKKVSDLIIQEEVQRMLYREWEERHRQFTKSFMEYLKDQGFTSLYDDEANVPYVEIDWGHRHGIHINYSETELDSLPSPIKIGESTWDDDEL